MVTLLTDFGTADPYVGILKGVVLGESRAVRSIVDLSHEVPPQDVATAAFFLAHSWRWFPRGTVHVAVVDPGVGSGRDLLVGERDGHAFVVPDNGLLGPALAGPGAPAGVRRVDVRRLGLERGSRTFHGRDRFAPLAAWLAGGTPPAALGSPHEGWRRLPAPCPEPRPGDEGGGWLARVVHVDRYGNLVTNAPAELLPAAGGRVEVGGRALPVVGTYAEAAPGELFALVDSYDLVEIAQRDGDAARALGLGRGAAVLLPPLPGQPSAPRER